MMLRKGITTLITSNYNRTFVIFCIVVSLLIADTMINYVSDFIYTQLVTGLGIGLFIAIGGAYIFGLSVMLKFVKHEIKDIRAKHTFIKAIHKTVTGIQYVLAATLVFIIFEILFFSQYHSANLTAVTAISQIATVGILSLFAQRFFSWYKSNRSSIVVLLYGLSFAINAFALGVISINELTILSEKQTSEEYALITPQSEVVFPSDSYEPGSFLANLSETYQYTDLISFALLMAATAILLYHYSVRVGKIRYWLIILLPMLYRLSMSLENFGLIVPSTDTEYFYWYLFTSLNSTAGGILFGIAFWTIAKTMRQDSAVKQYMSIAAYGFILIFISNQVTLTATSYPPFGAATLSFLVLAAYMIFLGLYSTAISISQDNQLRRSIKKFASQNSNLLGSIGTAHMEQEIQKTVKSMKGIVQEQEKELEEQTGIEANLEEDEMKKYLEEVMQEVGKAKKPST